MEKIWITNRHGKRLSVAFEILHKPSGLAFIAHGLGGYKEQPQIQAFAQAFLENNYSVVLWDAANTIGESEGNLENATITNYYEDLEDVANWAKKQKWYSEPFVLCGHSIGGSAVILYALNHQDQVRAIAPLSTFISGKHYFSDYQKLYPKELKEWKKNGFRVKESRSKPGVKAKVGWTFMEDTLKYDVISKASELKGPVLLISGDHDIDAPHQEELLIALTCRKELHIIKGAEHTFRTESELKEVKEIISSWIKKLN